MRIALVVVLLLTACAAHTFDFDPNVTPEKRVGAAWGFDAAEVNARDAAYRAKMVEQDKFASGFYDRLRCPPNETAEWASASAVEKSQMLKDCRRLAELVDAGTVK